MSRIDSLNKTVVPFRAPEIHNDIANFDKEKYFFFDKHWNAMERFFVLDNFQNTFYNWMEKDLHEYNFYPVNGSTEAIQQCLQTLSSTKKIIAILPNEYNYYRIVASLYNIEIRFIKTILDIDSNCVFITSIPFCRDGKISILQQQLLNKCNEDNIECWIDCAYIGTGKSVEFIIPKNTTNIFFTFSKNFALSFNRIGIWLSKHQITTLEMLKDYGYLPLGNLSLVTMLMQKYNKSYMWNNYRTLQEAVTDCPTDIVFLDDNGCITNKMTKLIIDRYDCNR